MSILAIDPGPEESAFVEYRDGRIQMFGKVPNADLKRDLARWVAFSSDELVVEMIASYGMPVGREVFETCVWIGRFVEAWGRTFSYLYRRDVKMHLCGNNTAKDANIRRALIDRFGPGDKKAIGNAKAPGPLHGITGDVWAALAVAVTHADTRERRAA